MIDTESQSSPLNFNSTDMHLHQEDLEFILIFKHTLVFSKYHHMCLLADNVFVGKLVSYLWQNKLQHYLTTLIVPHLYRPFQPLHKAGTCPATLHACEWDVTFWAPPGTKTHSSIFPPVLITRYQDIDHDSHFDFCKRLATQFCNVCHFICVSVRFWSYRAVTFPPVVKWDTKSRDGVSDSERRLNEWP